MKDTNKFPQKNSHKVNVKNFPLSEGFEWAIQDSKDRQHLTSGMKELDRILGGDGFETKMVYEVYGPLGAGKSNLLFQLICTALLPTSQGGLGAGTVFIDTERTFSLTRVQQIARRLKVNLEKPEQKIIRSAPPTSDMLIYLCERQLERLGREVGARLFCLDSLATHFRSEYGPGQIPARHQKAGRVVQALRHVARSTNGVVIMTNQTTMRSDVISQDRSWKYSLGNVVGHAIPIRLRARVKNSVTGLREITVEKALDLPAEKCEVYLGPLGFTDTPQKTLRMSDMF